MRPISLLYLLIVPGLPLGFFYIWLHHFVRRRAAMTRRPFDEMPRPAGWSLQNRMTDLMETMLIRLLAAIGIGVLSWSLAVMQASSPAVFLVPGFCATALLLTGCGRLLQTWSNHRLGLSGELVVGRILDQTSGPELHVFHDLEIREPGKKPWNIDHVVVNPAGVFAIETKARRKPKGTAAGGQQNHKIIYDGEQLRFPAPMQSDRHGLNQAKRGAEWLGNKLTALNGCPIAVIPVIVFPGWWVDRKARGEIHVLNQKELPKFLIGRPAILPPDRLRAICAQLEERCRIDLSNPA